MNKVKEPLSGMQTHLDPVLFLDEAINALIYN
ncbi:hypothetical protein NB311A_10163 [Nitrobacter sp. Nb-311A]|nr:hypothetical protein NB311A_10163 [Nitrobacter sp. Nb-311A]